MANWIAYMNKFFLHKYIKVTRIQNIFFKTEYLLCEFRHNIISFIAGKKPENAFLKKISGY